MYSQTDPTYLKNDFFVSYTKELGPRYYYAKLISTFTRFIPPKQTYFILTYLSHFFIYLVSLSLIKLFVKDKYFPYFIIYVLARFQHDTIGDAAVLNDNYLTPQLLAMPIILGGLYASIRGSYVYSFLATLIALPIQPSLTLLASVPIAGNLILNHKFPKKFLVTGLFFVILIFSTYFLFIRGREASVLSSESYIHILAYFRHPHHYVPSSFAISKYLFFFAETGILIGSFVYLLKKKNNPKGLLSILTIYILTILMLPAAYLFVEVLPIKQIVELQIFRVIFIHRWLFITMSLIALFLIVSKKINSKLITAICFVFSLGVLVLWPSPIRPTWPSLAIKYEQDRAGLYRFLENHTNKDALFLTPPDFGSMRIIPKRAIVVDWKSFPFNQRPMAIWYERIQSVYGQGDLDSNYRQITDEKLLSLKDKYAFDYAVLYVSTDTNFEIIYTDDMYKIIRM